MAETSVAVADNAAPIAAPKVLIADDDPAVLRLIATRCAKMGFEVQTASNGLNALLMARRSAPDVLIVDVNMPELDGLSLCFHMLTQAKKEVEVIVVSGNADPEIKDRCESYGAVYGRKGPDMWNVIRDALVELFPNVAFESDERMLAAPAVEVRERPRVLVVDDDPDVMEFFGSRLRKFGVDVLFANNGVQGYRIARREMPSVIISDCYMPEGDIHYLLWKLRGNRATEKIPVFVVSGRRLDLSAEANLRRDVCGQAGAVRLFRKSFDMSELFAALQEHCPGDYRPAQLPPMPPKAESGEPVV
jgi:CheY-like chemotaxis protein